MTRIVGHRGARGLAPENTIASLKKALEHDVDEVEIDVRVTKDAVPVLIHDSSLHDQAGNHLRVRDYTYEQLKTHKSDLSTLEEAIRAINRQVPLLIEVKPGEPVAPIVRVLKRCLADGYESGDFLLGSFSQRTLLALHQALPHIQKVVIEHFSGLRAAYRARQLNTRRLNMNQHFLWSGVILALHKSGYELYPFTLNSRAKAKHWARLGLAGIITDVPSEFEEKL